MRHQQRHEDGTEERGHAVEDEGAAIDEEENRGCDAQQALHNEVAEDLNRSHQRRHGRVVAGGLEKLKQVVQRVLIEGRNHRLRDIGKEMIDAEARARKRIDPIVFEQAADDEPEQEVDQIARVNGCGMKPERHAGGVPVHDHADEREERDAAQFRESKLRERAAVLRRQIGQIVGELIEPIDAGTCAG